MLNDAFALTCRSRIENAPRRARASFRSADFLGVCGRHDPSNDAEEVAAGFPIFGGHEHAALKNARWGACRRQKAEGRQTRGPGGHHAVSPSRGRRSHAFGPTSRRTVCR